MFRSKRFLLSAVLALVFSMQAALAMPVMAAEKVVAYYFHGTARCPTCYKLEQYSKETIEGDFKDELASGKLEFKVVNVEEKGNEHYVNDYNLYTKSLILSKQKDGKQVDWKNLDKIWEYVGNKQKFQDYVVREIKDFQEGG